MATWKSRGLRGSLLEEMLNHTNEVYKKCGLALIQKIPTPITPITIDKESRHITLAYFDQKSTVDYIGNVQGIPVCFDAKECAANFFALSNLHSHQFAFMKEFEEQKGIAFLILFFTRRNEAYYIPFRDLESFVERMESGGRKSFTYEEVDKSYRIRGEGEVLLHYLEGLSRDLREREEKKEG
ncbi:MAG: Holliday junction resolvase RecU [Johnsonella sp.]|nr:Holliday junction resolvase RecU [Johnsonella sp.]